MFNSNSNGYSLADIAAATGNSGSKQDGIWGDGASWWIIILFLFCFAGGWGNGGWGGSRNDSYATPGVNYSLDLAGLTSGYRDAMGSRAEMANGFCSYIFSIAVPSIPICLVQILLFAISGKQKTLPSKSIPVARTSSKEDTGRPFKAVCCGCIEK